jgi:hypothetical protein
MSLKSTICAAAAALGLLFTANTVSAAPALSGAASAVAEDVRGASNLEPVRWVCGPYGRRCVWVSHRPRVQRHLYSHYYYSRPRYYGFYGAPRYYHWRPAPRLHRWYW